MTTDVKAVTPESSAADVAQIMKDENCGIVPVADNDRKLQGVVTWFDNFCVLLRRDGHSQLVYKHAISTIMPGHPIQLFEGAEEGTPAVEKA